MFVENYKGAYILIDSNDSSPYYVGGNICRHKTLESCKEWIDGVILYSQTTEFKNGEHVYKTLIGLIFLPIFKATQL